MFNYLKIAKHYVKAEIVSLQISQIGCSWSLVRRTAFVCQNFNVTHLSSVRTFTRLSFFCCCCCYCIKPKINSLSSSCRHQFVSDYTKNTIQITMCVCTNILINLREKNKIKSQNKIKINQNVVRRANRIDKKKFSSVVYALYIYIYT
jgi:hypothetical protein